MDRKVAGGCDDPACADDKGAGIRRGAFVEPACRNRQHKDSEASVCRGDAGAARAACNEDGVREKTGVDWK